MRILLIVLLIAAIPTVVPPPSAPPQPAMTPAVGGHVTTGDPRNPAVMPEQRIDLKFSHRIHVIENDLECTQCHSDIESSRSTSDLNLPAKSACMDCHDPGEIPQEWGPKGGASSAISMPAAHLHFSHARHLSVEGITCRSCHEGVAQKDLATRDDLPSMETCLTCHDGKQAPDDCLTCHVKGRGGVIKTSYDSGELKPDDHGALWLRQHHVEAKRDMGYCASCHAQEDCLSCHEGSIPPSFHDGNYIVMHPAEAMANDPTCASCHRLDRFCENCHLRAGVHHEEPLFGGEGFHPPGWSMPGDPMHHQNVAKKNIGTCQACHHEEDCASCHAFYVGAPRTHPPGWNGSRRMERLIRANPSLCLQCHGRGEPDDPYIPPP